MTDYNITLPEQTYRRLCAIAREQGISPESWIAAQLPEATVAAQPLSDLLAGLTGAIDSQSEPRHSFQKTAFGEGLAAKLAKQGIHRPWYSTSRQSLL